MNRVSWLFKRLSFGCISLAVLLCVERAEAQARVAPVIVAPVIQKQAASGQTFVGTVMPLKKSAVGAAVDGRVTEFPINEGDRVTKGQPLAKLLTETISLQIVAAQAELKFREEELRELSNGWRKEEVEQAAAKMEAARSRREYTGQRLKRTLALFEKGQVGTREQIEEDSSAAVYAQQTYEAERLGHELMKQGPRPERIEQSKARVAEQTALVQQLQDQLKKHTMIAPFDGYIVAEKTEIGEWVTKGQVVAEVIYLDEIDIEAHVLDTHIEHVRVGTTVRVEVPALKSSIFVGEVANIARVQRAFIQVLYWWNNLDVHSQFLSTTTDVVNQRRICRWDSNEQGCRTGFSSSFSQAFTTTNYWYTRNTEAMSRWVVIQKTNRQIWRRRISKQRVHHLNSALASAIDQDLRSSLLSWTTKLFAQ